MNRLQKFFEQGAHCGKLGRVAYAFQASSLPEPQEGMTWQLAQSFHVADELLQDPDLKDVFKAAVSNGYAVVIKGISPRG
jgi:hypothetical protein